MTNSSGLGFMMNKYKILGKKGEGTFSEVLKCQTIKDGTYFACKKMKQHYESLEQVNKLREIQALRRLNPHANILQMEEVAFDTKNGTLVIVCELMDMNIYELIRGKRHYLPERLLKLYMYQLLRSIDHMHRNGIFHRDIKPENILIKDEILKLADFGSCRGVYSKQPYTEYISTRWYRAPECLLTDGYYTYKMDIWSVGCVFFEVMSLHPLFPGSNEVDQIAKIHDIIGTPDPNLLNKFRNKTRGMNFNFPAKKGTGIEKMLPHASQECIELIYQMCTYDPDERIQAKDALRHPYFKELRDAEKRAAAVAAAKKRKEEQISQTAENQTEAPKQTEIKPTKVPESKSPVVADKKTLSVDTRPVEEKKSLSPVVGTNSILARYPASILQNKEPVYGYHRRDRKRKRYKRMAASGPSPVQGSSFFPKVQPVAKPSTFQPTFNLGTYGMSYSLGGSSLPKLGAPNANPNMMFPSLSPTFAKGPGKVTKAPPAATKNMYGRYQQLPSIDDRH